MFEVQAHWISSYFLGDEMRLPSSVEEAFADADRVSAWMRKRFPGMLHWYFVFRSHTLEGRVTEVLPPTRVNESYSSGLVFWKYVFRRISVICPDVSPFIRSAHPRLPMNCWKIWGYLPCVAVAAGLAGLSRSSTCRKLLLWLKNAA